MIRIGILGYGNLGRGVECALQKSSDMNLVAVFTRRDPASLKLLTAGVPVVGIQNVLDWKDKIDVMILCGGSATDLPMQTPEFAKHFNVIDSFDTHAKIPSHFAAVDSAAKAGNKVAIISVGWDPGLFSLSRVYADSILPNGETYTFWGKGVSQGHSDAVRRIRGVKNAKQYTIPIESAFVAACRQEFGAPADGTQARAEVIGPAPALVAKFRGTYRFVVLIKARDLAAVQTYLRSCRLHLRTDVAIDIDPITMM